MDPNENLKDQLALAAIIQRYQDCDGMNPNLDQEVLETCAIELARRVIALNEWIRKGGFLPAAWVKAGACRP